jgi:uncharacterized membrane protein
VLPPLAFALALPLSRQRCNHFTAELGLRLKLSAASRRDAPASTASITRSRKSSEYGFGVVMFGCFPVVAGGMRKMF